MLTTSQRDDKIYLLCLLSHFVEAPDTFFESSPADAAIYRRIYVELQEELDADMELRRNKSL